MTKREKIRFGTGGGRREIVRFALPAAGFGLFQQAYGLVYTAIVSRTLSLTAIAVLGACAAFAAMQSYVANGMTTGFGIYLSRSYGQGDSTFYRNGFTAALALNGVLGAAAVLLAAGIRPLMVLAGIPEGLWADCRSYLVALLIGTGFLGFYNLMFYVLQGAGNSTVPGLAAAAGVVTQTLLLTAFIRLGPGICAPPCAVLANNALWGGVMFAYFRRHDRKRAKLLHLRQIPGSIWRELFANGFAKAGMMVLVGIGGFFMQRAQNTLEPDVLAGISLADTLSNFFLVPLSALAQTASAAAGQNMGRREYANIRAYNRRLFRYHVVCSGGIVLACMLSGRRILCLMADTGGDSAVIRAGEQWLVICIPAFFGLGAAMICRNCLQAMGSYRKLIWLGVLEMGITVGFALFGVPRFGYPALCVSIAVKWMALGAAAGYWYRQRLRSLERI